MKEQELRRCVAWVLPITVRVMGEKEEATGIEKMGCSVLTHHSKGDGLEATGIKKMGCLGLTHHRVMG